MPNPATQPTYTPTIQPPPDRLVLIPPGSPLRGLDGRSWHVDLPRVLANLQALGSIKLEVDHYGPIAGELSGFTVRSDGALMAHVTWTAAGLAAYAQRGLGVSPTLLYEPVGASGSILGTVIGMQAAALVKVPNFQMLALNSASPVAGNDPSLRFGRIEPHMLHKGNSGRDIDLDRQSYCASPSAGRATNATPAHAIASNAAGSHSSAGEPELKFAQIPKHMLEASEPGGDRPRMVASPSSALNAASVGGEPELKFARLPASMRGDEDSDLDLDREHKIARERAAYCAGVSATRPTSAPNAAASSNVRVFTPHITVHTRDGMPKSERVPVLGAVTPELAQRFAGRVIELFDPEHKTVLGTLDSFAINLTVGQASGDLTAALKLNAAGRAEIVREPQLVVAIRLSVEVDGNGSVVNVIDGVFGQFDRIAANAAVVPGGDPTLRFAQIPPHMLRGGGREP